MAEVAAPPTANVAASVARPGPSGPGRVLISGRPEVFGARFSKEVLALGLALGLVTALVEPIGRLTSDGPAWPTIGPRNLRGPVMASRGANPGAYNLHLVPYGIDRGVCDRSTLAADVKDGLIAAADILVGGTVGAKMDAIDQACVSNALEFAGDQRRVLWRNGNSGLTYTLIAHHTYQTDRGTYCREYSASAQIAGQPQDVRQQACRQPGGGWSMSR